MSNDSRGTVGLRPYAHRFFLSGSYWFGLVALALHAATYGLFGLATVKEQVHREVEYWRETSHVSGVGVILRHWTSSDMPAWFFYSAVSFAGLGAAPAVVAFLLCWKRPIPSVLALLINMVPALVALGLILHGRWG
jgi:hypothetical protein